MLLWQIRLLFELMFFRTAVSTCLLKISDTAPLVSFPDDFIPIRTTPDVMLPDRWLIYHNEE
jgi:hypothetical protein